ncbi:general odorant-binding protein 28a-like [Spodoptera litura]|uniref:General odorant-binding protein 28a-like n=1 Tax=Spodoptera litura TaxID=69820 RepID=A0A0M4JRQ2_SPOLT|nr:general odorant-binding protein 28a-like [Spodoptera litura]ALD65896.1 odorant binding protein 22 [Spodoptera litura]
MSKFTCIILCVVAASLTKVSHAAVTEEEKEAFREAMAPIIAECSEEHGVSEADIKAAKESASADNIKPCFLGCVMKKIEVLDAKGLYDAETGLGKLRKFVKDDDEFAKFEDIAKKCLKVNDESVSDGEAGCDRAKLVLGCFIEHKVEMPF